jgi:division protein CdvB (Snf7/Vps24/ESCRT-III family)
VDDVLEGVLEGSDDEAQSDAIVNQVLDEIGIEIKSDLNNIPAAKGSIGASKAKSNITDADIDKMLAELK